MAKQRESMCGWCWEGGRRFPTFAVIILAIGVIWFLNETKVFSVDIPWFPVIMVVLALGWIIDHYRKR